MKKSVTEKMRDTVIILSCLVFAFGTVQSQPVVNTTTGHVMGRVVPAPPALNLTVPGKQFSTVSQFLGIPYAEAPTGMLRFAKPVRKSPWNGVKDAVAFGPSCPQYLASNDSTDEDCLSLNIYVPDSAVNSSGHVPVMVWIHGGWFVSGQGALYDGSVLSLLGGVVVVTINYRLGVLGFLSTADDIMPGNYGLWDQKLALHWVKDNINSFGGDPHQITLFGESAGSFSVTYHMLTPLNDRSLFQRAIAESGSASAGLVMTHDVDQVYKQAVQVATALGCNSTSSTSSLLACFQEASVDSLLLTSHLLEHPIVIDGEFISDRIDNLLSLQHFSQYDLLMGSNSNEGSVFIPFVAATEISDEQFTQFVDRWMYDICQCSNTKALIDVGKFVYAIDDTDHVENARKLYELLGDSFFVVPDISFLQQHVLASNDVNTFSYYLTYDRVKEILVPSEYLEVIPGSPHALDIFYVFGFVLSLGKSADDTAQLSQDIIAYWTNFAKYG